MQDQDLIFNQSATWPQLLLVGSRANLTAIALVTAFAGTDWSFWIATELASVDFWSAIIIIVTLA